MFNSYYCSLVPLQFLLVHPLFQVKLLSHFFVHTFCFSWVYLLLLGWHNLIFKSIISSYYHNAQKLSLTSSQNHLSVEVIFTLRCRLFATHWPELLAFKGHWKLLFFWDVICSVKRWYWVSMSIICCNGIVVRSLTSTKSPWVLGQSLPHFSSLWRAWYSCSPQEK